jgi:hypothetical protein
MNFFKEEEKVNFVKWYYSGPDLSFRDMQAPFYQGPPIPSLTCHTYCYFDKFFNSLYHYCVLPADVKKQKKKKKEMRTIFKTLQLLFQNN